jgi:hypothetical protein
LRLGVSPGRLLCESPLSAARWGNRKAKPANIRPQNAAKIAAARGEECFLGAVRGAI